ncbi:hypothetical protein [Bacillus wiedmannii]|nr:hypothetical protein [Bacillus wiedmannii]
MNEEKVYGLLGLINVSLDEHRRGQVTLEQLVQTISSYSQQLDEEVLGK